MTTELTRILKIILRLLVTTSMLALAFRNIDSTAFLNALKTAKWQFFAAASIVTVIFFWLNSIKTRCIFKKLNCDIQTKTLFAVSSITSLYTLFIPGLLTNSIKWYILKKETSKGAQVLSAMIYNQLSRAIVMSLAALTALLSTKPSTAIFTTTPSSTVLKTLYITLTSAIIIISLLLLNKKSHHKLNSLTDKLFAFLPPKMHRKTSDMINHLTTFQNAGIFFHLAITLMTISFVLMGNVLIYFFAAKAANITLPISVFFWLSATIYILGLIPISIANLGIRELTIAGFLSIYNIEKSSALLMSMTIFSTTLTMAVIGACCHIYWSLKNRK